MSCNWPRVQISEVCELIVDCVNKTAPRVDYETPFKMIRTPNVKGGKISLNDCRFVEEDTYEKWTRRAKVLRDDVLLTREAPMGEVGIVDFDETVFLGQRIMQYRVDSSKLDPHFLLYSFLSSDLQHQFNMHEGSGSVVSHIRVPDCSKFELNLPPLDVQKEIAGVLKKLDRKISVNQQTNQTLEEMAQAIFKSWFVDFDPVKAKMKGEQPEGMDAATTSLFPEKLVESELGLIPEGWSEQPLGSLIDFMTGFAFKSKQFTEAGVRLARGDNVKEGRFYWGDKSRFWPEVTPELDKYHLKSGDILIGMDGSKVGKNWVRVNESDLPCLLVQRVARLRAKGLIGSSMLEVIIGGNKFKQYVENVKTGTSIPHISGKQIKEMPIIYPNDGGKLFQRFEEILRPLAHKRELNNAENQELAQLRDILLPKLLSGEIELGTTEALGLEA
ncbi:restriction endonuclease subunit S [Vibrio vulnificus]|uniref:restriction endonuclease subunit S n=1 Tax=Vibrio vulnificus TaxID=672 RepID=UPI004059AEB4